jgi:hypothetical protein
MKRTDIIRKMRFLLLMEAVFAKISTVGGNKKNRFHKNRFSGVC